MFLAFHLGSFHLFSFCDGSLGGPGYHSDQIILPPIILPSNFECEVAVLGRMIFWQNDYKRDIFSEETINELGVMRIIMTYRIKNLY